MSISARGPQQVLVMATYGCTMRSEAFGWTAETGEGVYRDPVGYNLPLCGADSNYDNVLHALKAGWHLLAPPRFDGVEHREGEDDVKTFEWWLVREVRG